jgi:RNA polymerase sigma-70 factor (ECF subfamily)
MVSKIRNAGPNNEGLDASISPPARSDCEAFTALYDSYFDRVYRFLYSRVGTVHDAEDLTAATFLSAVEAFPRYKHQGKFAAWLFTIARRKAADHFRKPIPVSLADVEDSPAEQDLLSQVADNDQLFRLKERLRGLSIAEREWLDLHFGAGLTFSEMSAVIGKSEDAVKKSVYRLCARLHKDLE